MYIDTHAHLYAGEFSADSAAMVSRALSAGVSRIVLPNIDDTSIPMMCSLAAEYPEHLFPLIGLHPTSVDSNFAGKIAVIESSLRDRSYIGIGETGIDLYWDKSFLKEQIESFTIQLTWARDLNIPVIIHVRDSFPETLATVRKMQDGRLRGIFHCFSGNPEEANEVLDLGFHIGIGGVVTFKNSTLHTFLSAIDINRIVLETDAPYLAPVPYRGKRNESSYLPIIAKRVAELYDLPVEAIARITTANAESLFDFGNNQPTI